MFRIISGNHDKNKCSNPNYVTRSFYMYISFVYPINLFKTNIDKLWVPMQNIAFGVVGKYLPDETFPRTCAIIELS